jgi:bis(5'-nucleosyl)-tetraphosphatase (symmetrical)
VSTYVVGDIQGCHSALEMLLTALNFDRTQDQLWITGDLVNRGEDSLAVLRWCVAHDDCVVAVLGNHDLHLLAVAEGFVPPHRKDTLDMILAAPDRDILLTWLRHRPMLHRDGPWLMLHAGLPPEWSADEAEAHAGELESALRGADWRKFLGQMYGNEPRSWSSALQGQDRLRFIANALTRTRYLHPDGSLEFQHKLGLHTAPKGLTPWFDFPGRASAIGKNSVRILFGHWSTLGLLVREDVIALDTGCLWGGALTAFRLDDEQCFQIRCRSGA